MRAGPSPSSGTHAHMQGVAEGRDYTIEIDDLKPDGHKGYEMVEEAIEALMRTILTLKLAGRQDAPRPVPRRQ